MIPSIAAVMAAQKIAAGGGGGGITLVQSKYMTTNAFGTTHTWTPDSGITPGSTVLLGFYIFDSTLPLGTVQTNTAVALTQAAIYDATSYNLYWYILSNAGSGVTSISFTINSGNGGVAHGFELAGVTNTSPVDATASGDNGSETGPHNDVTVTTTADNDFVATLYRTDSRTLDSMEAGYTGLPTSGTDLTSWVSYTLDAGTAGVKAPGINFTALAGSNALAIALKKA